VAQAWPPFTQPGWATFYPLRPGRLLPTPSLISVSPRRTIDIDEISPVLLLDIETIGIADEISLLSHIQAEIYIIPYHFQLLATIFDFSLTPTHGSV